jgi:phospholipid/cholesterol/gamma-HCH transport system substrate-binding protein
MKLRTVEITVGAFMIIGILCLLMLAIQVSGLSNFVKEEPGYRVRAEFTNIGSLKVRAKVTIAGVAVGRVVKIQLEPDTYNATVWLALDPKRLSKLPTDTRASILTAGLLGDNYISLTPGFSESFLKEGDIISINDTDSAIILEQLVSKFLANQLSSKSASASPQLKSGNGLSETEQPKVVTEQSKVVEAPPVEERLTEMEPSRTAN